MTPVPYTATGYVGSEVVRGVVSLANSQMELSLLVQCMIQFPLQIKRVTPLEAILQEMSRLLSEGQPLHPAHRRCIPTGLFSIATEEKTEARRVQVRCGMETGCSIQSP